MIDLKTLILLLSCFHDITCGLPTVCIHIHCYPRRVHS